MMCCRFLFFVLNICYNDYRYSSEPRAVLTEQAAKPDAPPVYDVSSHSLVLFDRGDEITVQAGNQGIRFLLVSGKPIE